MKRITITTRCIATVTEDWVLDVPDDFDPATFDSADYDHDLGNLMLALVNGETEVETAFVRCTDVDVDDEHDRAFVAWYDGWEEFA